MMAELTTISAYQMKDETYTLPIASESIRERDRITFFKKDNVWYARRVRWLEHPENIGKPFFNGAFDVIEKGSTVLSARPTKDRMLSHSLWVVK